MPIDAMPQAGGAFPKAPGSATTLASSCDAGAALNRYYEGLVLETLEALARSLDELRRLEKDFHAPDPVAIARIQYAAFLLGRARVLVLELNDQQSRTH